MLEVVVKGRDAKLAPEIIDIYRNPNDVMQDMERLATLGRFLRKVYKAQHNWRSRIPSSGMLRSVAVVRNPQNLSIS
jgi:hypothetical protein